MVVITWQMMKNELVNMDEKHLIKIIHVNLCWYWFHFPNSFNFPHFSCQLLPWELGQSSRLHEALASSSGCFLDDCPSSGWSLDDCPVCRYMVFVLFLKWRNVWRASVIFCFSNFHVLFHVLLPKINQLITCKLIVIIPPK
jgi:hypothetical protein